MTFAVLQTPFSPTKKGAKSFTLPSVLPHDIESLKTLLIAQHNAHNAQIESIRQEAHNYVIRMLEQAILARRRMFGTSSEQQTAQSRLFDEAEVLVQASTESQDTAPQVAQSSVVEESTPSEPSNAKPARGKRVALASGLPRVDVLHDVPRLLQVCPLRRG